MRLGHIFQIIDSHNVRPVPRPLKPERGGGGGGGGGLANIVKIISYICDQDQQAVIPSKGQLTPLIPLQGLTPLIPLQGLTPLIPLQGLTPLIPLQGLTP